MEETLKKKYDLPDYPYELFVEETEDETFVCLIETCGLEFNTYDEYIAHYAYNYSHQNYIKRNLEFYQEKKKNFAGLLIDPIEKALLEDNIRNNKDYYNLRYNKDVTYLLDEKIDFSVTNKRMISAEIVGISGVGKSWLGISLAYTIAGKWAEKLGRPTQVHIGFTLADTLDLIKKAEKGDVIIQDEDPKGFGSGSQTNESALENLLKTMRKNCISFIIISPIDTKVTNVNFRLEVIAQIPKERMSKAVLYTRKNQALGYVYVEVLDDEDYVEYEQRKDEFIKNMRDSGGFGIDNYSEERIDADIGTLLAIVKEKDVKMKKSRINTLSAIYVKGDSRYQDLIAGEVFDVLKYEKTFEQDSFERPVEVEKLGIKYIWNHTRTETDIGILKDMYDFASKMKLSEDERRGLEAWRLIYIENLRQQAATTELNKIFTPMTRPAYFQKGTGKIYKFIQGVMGNAGEFTIQKWFYPTYTHSGIVGEPDLIGDNHIVEVKVRDVDDKRSIEALVDRDEYIRNYIDRNYPITIVVIWYGAGSVKIDFYSIEYVGTDSVSNNVN